MTQRTLIAAAASAAAGLVHAAAAGTHNGTRDVALLFALTAAAQVAWAAVASTRPGRPVLAGGLALNGAAVGAWAVSRTVGLPWPSGLTGVEDVGSQDLLAAVLGAVAALSAAAGLVRRLDPGRGGSRLTPGVAVTGVLALALAVPAMAAEHTHGDHSDDGDHGDHAGHDDHAAAGGHDDTEPIVSLDDARLTSTQQEAATSIIERTTDAMDAYPDQAAVEAAGYVSIGDSVTGYEHFVNPRHIADGAELDPARVESIVLEVDPDGSKRVVSAMYILNPGTTMAEAPDIAGELTTWHDHQNLCFEGIRVVAVTGPDGSCPRGQLRPTAPMLHVWLVEHPCGPFAGLEGHGGSEDCSHSH
jgi:hypothetical protein